MHRRTVVSVVCLVIMSAGSAITLFSNIHSWSYALVVWLFSGPWIGFWGYLMGRTDEERIHHDELTERVMAEQGDEIRELSQCEAVLRTKTRIRFNFTQKGEN